MKSEFRICKSSNCGITITGLELDGDGYLDESSSSIAFKEYKWSETITLNLMYSMNAKEKKKLVNYDIVIHKDALFDF